MIVLPNIFVNSTKSYMFWSLFLCRLSYFSYMVISIIIWYMLLLLMLYLISNLVVLIVLLILLVPFNYIVFIMYELMVVVFLLLVLLNSSTSERNIATYYLLFFGYVLRIFLILCNTLMLMRFLILIVRYSKLPMYGLHIWLPKVHVEASMLGSIILAGAVLKLGILFLWNFGSLSILFMMVLIISPLSILVIVDGKSFIAYSSVLHISCCVVIAIVLIIYIGYIHVVLSPLIFVIVYQGYINSRSRYLIKLRLLILLLMLMNFRFPYLGAFHTELYIMSYIMIVMCVIILMYILTGYVFIKSLVGIGNRLYYLPVVVLYLVVL